jgi:hypothetical protein
MIDNHCLSDEIRCGDGMNSSGTQPAASPGTSDAPANRWAVLALLGVAQLMVVLDVTIVNIALVSRCRPQQARRTA